MCHVRFHLPVGVKPWASIVCVLGFGLGLLNKKTGKLYVFRTVH
jgi:hypothetical protein